MIKKKWVKTNEKFLYDKVEELEKENYRLKNEVFSLKQRTFNDFQNSSRTIMELTKMNMDIQNNLNNRCQEIKVTMRMGEMMLMVMDSNIIDNVCESVAHELKSALYSKRTGRIIQDGRFKP